jgi:hypothetical protein
MQLMMTHINFFIFDFMFKTLFLNLYNLIILENKKLYYSQIF